MPLQLVWFGVSVCVCELVCLFHPSEPCVTSMLLLSNFITSYLLYSDCRVAEAGASFLCEMACYVTQCGLSCFLYVQSELRMRLIKLNWQKSMCSRVKAMDEQAKSDAKVLCAQNTCYVCLLKRYSMFLGHIAVHISGQIMMIKISSPNVNIIRKFVFQCAIELPVFMYLS